MAYDRDTVDAFVDDTGADDGTVMSKAQFSAIVDDLEKGWHLVKTDTQPYVQGDDTNAGIKMGPGGSTSPDALWKRIAAAELGARNIGDSAYIPIRASEYKIATTTVIDGSGNLTPLGDAPATPSPRTLYRDSIVHAWVRFDGTGTPAITDDFNVSSITDNGTGDYTINFAAALATANYSVIITCEGASTAGRIGVVDSGNAPTTGAVRILTMDLASTLQDVGDIHVVVIGE